MRFQGKTALITGGGRGIWATTALMMLAEGGEVGVVYINQDHLNRVTETARTRGYKLKTFLADVSKTDHVQSTVDAFIREFGRIVVRVGLPATFIAPARARGLRPRRVFPPAPDRVPRGRL